MKANKLMVLALAVFLMASGKAFALTISSDGVRGDANRIYTTVVNNSAAALTSGTVVVWDSSGADSTLGAYVTTTTTADSNLVAGVVVSDSILASGVGTIQVYGPRQALYADSTDGATDTAGTAVGTSTVDGQFGNGTGLGCILGETAALVSDGKLVTIFIDPSNGE